MKSKHYLIQKMLECFCCCEYIYFLCKKARGDILWSKMDTKERYDYLIDFLNNKPDYLFICIHNDSLKCENKCELHCK